ncbi:hypothetical protein P4210_28775, partial [Bacillus thuringiensis]|nr:hypothetical protein [Bacillus thuringiensis]
MYYANENHKRNYLRLLTERGTKHGEDPEYEAAFYITAYPEIHKCFDWNKFKTEFSPLGALLSKEPEERGVSTAPLTSSTWGTASISEKNHAKDFFYKKSRYIKNKTALLYVKDVNSFAQCHVIHQN